MKKRKKIQHTGNVMANRTTNVMMQSHNEQKKQSSNTQRNKLTEWPTGVTDNQWITKESNWKLGHRIETWYKTHPNRKQTQFARCVFPPSRRPQNVRMGDQTSSTLTLNTGTPQGCVPSPLYSLFTNDCLPIHPSNTIVKFADDTTIVGLITDNNETAYREEIQHFTEWCSHNNLDLNITKTKELIVNFRKSKYTEHSALCIHNEEVEMV